MREGERPHAVARFACPPFLRPRSEGCLELWCPRLEAGLVRRHPRIWHCDIKDVAQHGHADGKGVGSRIFSFSTFFLVYSPCPFAFACCRDDGVPGTVWGGCSLLGDHVSLLLMRSTLAHARSHRHRPESSGSHTEHGTGFPCNLASAWAAETHSPLLHTAELYVRNHRRSGSSCIPASVIHGVCESSRSMLAPVALRSPMSSADDSCTGCCPCRQPRIFI